MTTTTTIDNRAWRHALVPALLAALAAWRAGPSRAALPPMLRIDAPEARTIDFSRSDGGLPRLPGARTFVVHASDDRRPEPDGEPGYTYQHHPDLACWQGRLYVAWEACARDEDTWPSKELYSASADGEHWSAPAELFPQGTSTALRTYFYRSKAGPMLAIAGLRTSHRVLNERTKGPLVVREVRPDHGLGPVFTLQPPATGTSGTRPPAFTTAGDAAFVGACRQLLDDRTFLEQQDYGVLLPAEHRMRWNDPTQWPAVDGRDGDPREFGRAMCFFTRRDGTLVGIGKRGWVTQSTDGGRSWDLPQRPPSLVTGNGKVWGQALPNGHALLVYNPDEKRRWPLACVTSDDGVVFRHMQSVHGDLPAPQYPGKHKDPGASYVRGIGPWASDDSRHDGGAVWLVFSVNKEQIWVARVPIA